MAGRKATTKKAEEVKAEEVKAEEVKSEEVKAEEVKATALSTANSYISSAFSGIADEIAQRSGTVTTADGQEFETYKVKNADGETTELNASVVVQWAKVLTMTDAVDERSMFIKARGFAIVKEREVHKTLGFKSFTSFIESEYPNTNPKTAQVLANVGATFFTGETPEEFMPVSTIIPALPIFHYNQLLSLANDEEYGIAFLEKETIKGNLWKGMSQKQVKDFVNKARPVDPDNKDGNKGGNKDGQDGQDGQDAPRKIDLGTAKVDEIIAHLGGLLIKADEVITIMGVARNDVIFDEETDLLFGAFQSTLRQFIDSKPTWKITQDETQDGQDGQDGQDAKEA